MTELSIPTIIVNLGLFMPQAITASFIGRKLGTEHLDGFTLGNLTANLLTLSVLQGLFTANDTLSPQAFGSKNYKEVGLLAVRGYFLGIAVVFPANFVLFLFMEQILLAIGQPTMPAAYAAQYYRIYMLSLPFYILYVMVWKFLAAQEIMRPLVIVFVFSCGTILPLSLSCLVEWYGFIGAPLALDLYMFCQTVLLVLYVSIIKPHHPSTWEGLNWREALAVKPVKTYLALGFGGILASSEWWFWEVLVLIIGSFGVIPLSIHTIAVQVIMVTVMIPSGIGIALSVRVGATISQNVERAKQLMLWSFVLCSTLYIIMALLMYVFRQEIFSLFTTDPVVIEGANALWWKVMTYFVLVGTFLMNVFAAAALGIQWIVGVVGTVTLWVLTTPAVVIFAIWKGGGIEAAWTTLLPSYSVMNMIIFYSFFTFDWESFSQEVRDREGVSDETVPMDENRPLLSVSPLDTC